jgi:hypothetical protein
MNRAFARRVLGMWLAALLVTSHARAAFAFDCAAPSGEPSEDEESARKMFNDALALEASDPKDALERLRCAQRHADKPAIALRMGTIAERLRDRREAIAAFERYLALAGDSAPDREQLRERIVGLRRELERERAKPAPAPAPAPQPTSQGDEGVFIAGWVVGSVGVGVAIAGAVLLAVAKDQSDSVAAIPPGTVAWDSDEARDTFEAAERHQALGIAGLVIGGALIAGGVVMTVLSRPRVSVALGIDRMVVGVRF